MFGKKFWEARDAAHRGLAGDTGINDPVSEGLIGQAPLEQMDPALIGADPVGGAQTVAQDQYHRRIGPRRGDDRGQAQNPKQSAHG